MTANLKHSPLCSRDNGNELFFTVKKTDAKYRVVVPCELLDDACGNSGTGSARKAWATQHMPQLLDAFNARSEGGLAHDPFNRILVEEIS